MRDDDETFYGSQKAGLRATPDTSDWDLYDFQEAENTARCKAAGKVWDAAQKKCVDSGLPGLPVSTALILGFGGLLLLTTLLAKR